VRIKERFPTHDANIEDAGFVETFSNYIQVFIS